MYEEKDAGAILAIVGTAVILCIAIFGGKYLPKMKEAKSINPFEPNMELHNLRVYVPFDWTKADNYQMSPSGKCQTLGATTNYSQETVERGLFSLELDHEKRTINGIEMSYGYKETDTRKYYSYYFTDDDYKYMLVFVNDIDSDDVCNNYLEQLEKSITLVKWLC